MATVTFSAADDVLYAYLAGEIDHDAAPRPQLGRHPAHPARAGTAPAGLTTCRHPLHRAGRGNIRRDMK